MTRDEEVASALAEFFRRGVQNGDWRGWVEVLSPDATLTHNGNPVATDRDTIGATLLALLEPYPCVTFSVEWMMTSGDDVAVWLWTHFPDPEGTEYAYEFPTLVLLRYADGGSWGAIDTFANPAEIELVLADWHSAGGSGGQAPDHGLIASNPSHPQLPSPSPDHAIIEAVCDALATENWLDLIETGGADWHDHGGYGIAHWADGERRELRRIVGDARAVVVLDRGSTAALVVHVNETGRVTYLDHLYDPAVLVPAGR